MTETSAHGKHLFLHFDEDIVHIHLGLYGWFTTRKNKGQIAKDSIRLRITNEDFVSDLVGPTACEIFSLEAKKLKINKLGPDPIHDDADPEKAWTKIHKSSRSIGGLLMDQSIIAGIGNVYRAELLFLAKLSPFIEGKNLDKEKFNNVWTDSVRLLKL
jgi:endonuclease-8